jgi:pimeloyl-ACP methyl ester carboxylesterase
MATTTLSVPGAQIHYERAGSGPLLLMITGGNGDAGTFAQVAALLAADHTVVTYDRRGFARSPLVEPPDGRRYDDDVADAARLIDHLGDGPADVFGSSSGAIVGLALLSRYPDRVRRLVAHEPPAFTLLPDRTALDILDRVHELAGREGTEEAMRTFSGAMGLGEMPPMPDRADLPPPVVEMIERIQRNLAFWMEHELRQYPSAPVDVAALEAAKDKLVLAGGADSHDTLPYQPNTVLAERLGQPVVDFPGGHVGYVVHPAEFAARLRAVLAS